MTDLVGKILKKRYKVVESLGRGGMADVYKVWDEERAVYLAMKVLRQDLAQDPIFLRRFQREAKALAGLQHPHIVRFYGLERDDLLAFLLMEYVDGVSLQGEILRSEGKPLPMERIQDVMQAVCSALHYAHHQGLVHCDIKPGNILIDKHGQIYLTDFGIARGMDAATSTMVGIGTPAYMAPELIKGQDPTPQTDIYALGIVLYEMLTGGERPFTGERATITGTTAEKVRWEHLMLEPIPISSGMSKSLLSIQSVIACCLNKDSDKRYKDVYEIKNAVEAIIKNGVINGQDVLGEEIKNNQFARSGPGNNTENPKEMVSEKKFLYKPTKIKFFPDTVALSLGYIVYWVMLFMSFLFDYGFYSNLLVFSLCIVCIFIVRFFRNEKRNTNIKELIIPFLLWYLLYLISVYIFDSYLLSLAASGAIGGWITGMMLNRFTKVEMKYQVVLILGWTVSVIFWFIGLAMLWIHGLINGLSIAYTINRTTKIPFKLFLIIVGAWTLAGTITSYFSYFGGSQLVFGVCLGGVMGSYITLYGLFKMKNQLLSEKSEK